jgi:uncharacterized membrane protein
MFAVILRVAIIFLQLFVGLLLGWIPAYGLGIGNGWELVAIAIGNTLGIWGVGVLGAILRRRFVTYQAIVGLIGTFVGSLIGVLVILMTPAIGFIQLLYPLICALVGYYVAVFLSRDTAPN